MAVSLVVVTLAHPPSKLQHLRAHFILINLRVQRRHLEDDRQRPGQMGYDRVPWLKGCPFQRCRWLGESADGPLDEMHLVVELLTRQTPSCLHITCMAWFDLRATQTVPQNLDNLWMES